MARSHVPPTFKTPQRPCGSVLVLACLAAAFCASRAFAGEPAVPAPHPNDRSPLGINLSGIADWSTEMQFVDVFKRARPWISQREGTAWGQGPKLDLDTEGWVKRLEPGCRAETFLIGLPEGAPFPRGTYVALYDGEGRIGFGSGAKPLRQQPGRVEVNLDGLRGPLTLSVLETNPANYVRNIRVLMPGHKKTYRDEPFCPEFIRRYEPFKVYRFMDWGETNNSKIRDWADRARPDGFSMATKGVALEWMILLANKTHTDPWFCMPHLASDDFVRQYATMVRDRLDPGLKVYVEYSNEVWNGQFAQQRYAGDQGLALGLAEKHWEAGWRYYARRSVQIFKIWEEVFGGHDRLVRVLASQSANPYVSGVIVRFEDAYQYTDALAIAPYFGGKFGAPKTADEVAGWTLERLFDECRKDQQEYHARVREAVELARPLGLEVIAYEGGQHLVGHGGAENNQKLMDLFHRANRDPRMKELYLSDLAGWKQAGGRLFAAFAGMGAYSKWGSWGIIEHEGQRPGEVPKFSALLEFIERNPRWW